MLCSTLRFRPGNLSCSRRYSKCMVALETSSLDKNNFVHFPPGFMILKMIFPLLWLLQYTLKAKAGYCSHSGKGMLSRCSGFRLLSTTKQILTQSSREPDSKATTKLNLHCATFKMAAPGSVVSRYRIVFL